MSDNNYVSLPKRLKIPQPDSLSELLEQFKRDIFLTLNCHGVATVQSFQSNAGTGRPPMIQGEMNYKRVIYTLENGVYQTRTADYAPLVDCPAIILGGGGANLTFPIEPGNEAMIFFNDRDIDNWLAGNSNGPVASLRAHSFTDAIALVGLYSSANPFAEYDMLRAVLQKGTAKVAVGNNDKVLIANGLQNLNTVLQSLITTLQGLTVNTSSGEPNPPWMTNLENIATQLAELLE